MKDLNYYFDLAKKKTGSDRQTAIRMKIAPNRISMAREKGVMSNEFCANLAEIAGVDPLEVIAAAEVKKHPEKAQFWGKWIAASVILSGAILMGNHENSITYAAFAFNSTIDYAQLLMSVTIVIFITMLGFCSQQGRVKW